MILKTMTVGPVQTNCYLIGDEAAGVCALVDPGDQAQDLLAMAADTGLALTAIFLTHGHFDHREAVPEILQVYPDLSVYIHKKDQLQPGLDQRFFYGGPAKIYSEGDTVSVGSLSFEVLETPGHTAGSVCLLGEELLFAGDTLFAGTCGRCDLPGGSMREMFSSLHRLAEIPGDRQVLPGHGPSTTLADERLSNPYMRRALRK